MITCTTHTYMHMNDITNNDTTHTTAHSATTTTYNTSNATTYNTPSRQIISTDEWCTPAHMNDTTLSQLSPHTPIIHGHKHTNTQETHAHTIIIDTPTDIHNNSNISDNITAFSLTSETS